MRWGVGWVLGKRERVRYGAMGERTRQFFVGGKWTGLDNGKGKERVSWWETGTETESAECENTDRSLIT